MVNFILNQLGLIVVLIAGFLIYRGYFEFDWYSGITISAILLFVLIASEMTYKGLKRDTKRKKRQIRSRVRVRAV